MTEGLTFSQYQFEAGKTAVYPGASLGSQSAILYTALGLAGEAGEVAGKVKKWMRDDDPLEEMSTDRRMKIADEISDVIWYCANLAFELNVDLGWIAQRNLDKLAARKEAGTLKGDGDNR